MSQERHAPRAPGSPSGGYGIDLAVAIAEILREGLAAGTDREALEAMLATVSARLGHPSMAVGRLDGDVLRLQAAHGFPPDTMPYDLTMPITRGIAGAAARTGRPVIARDATSDTRWEDHSGGTHRSGLAVPMHLADRVWGVLELESTVADAFTEDDAALLLPLADEMAWALETVRLRQEALARAEREEALRRQVEAISGITAAGLRVDDADAVLDRMVRETRDRLGWESLAILLRQPDRTLRVVSYYGYGEEVVAITFHEDHGIVGLVARTGQPYLASDTTADRYYDHVVGETRSEMCAPLRVAGEVRGVINAESPVPGRFGPSDLDVLVRLANQIGLVLHNAELLEAERAAVARLQELDRLKSEFVAITSHELRTPLTAVMGFAEVLERRWEALDDDRRRTVVEALGRQARVLSRLVEDVLVAARLDRGQLSIQITTLSLGDVVDEVLRDRVHAVGVGPGVDGLHVRADAVRLQQIIGNLIDNAIKYAEGAAIAIVAHAVDDRVVVCVRDEGPGIPPRERRRIFERFHQVGQHGVAGRRGVGLGLAIARELAEMMGGSLELDDAADVGASFLLTLPRAPRT